MIESIEFKNFKALRDTTLPLGPLTILVGPNGSGKSTVLQALEEFRLVATPRQKHQQMEQQRQMLAVNARQSFRQQKQASFSTIAHFRIRDDKDGEASVKISCRNFSPVTGFELKWNVHNITSDVIAPDDYNGPAKLSLEQAISRIRVYSLDADSISSMSPVQGDIELCADGTGLAAVLDGMRDDAPEQFKEIEKQIGQWLPEFDCILFDRPSQGTKSIALRTKEGQHKVPAADLSQGTLIALALLTLAYHPTPPSLIALEEPDRGIHPHLLRHVKDALVRLSHPESCGEKREPVQVIATTHSPYFIDLFRETPECIVVANKTGLDVQFQRLVDESHFHDILGQAALGDAWFSGVLGGVPSGS